MDFFVKCIKSVSIILFFICILSSCFFEYEPSLVDTESSYILATDPPYFYEDPDEKDTYPDDIKEKAEKEEREEEAFILNVRSKKIHKLTCGTASLILPENREDYTGRIEELYEIGYTQCGNCFK